MYKFLLVLLAVLAHALPASALTFEELTPYLSGQYFTWDESINGRRLLKESGPLVSAGVVAGFTTASSWTIKGRAEVFGGRIGYDGETQAPVSAKVQTDVNYFGTRQELDLGYRISSGNLGIEPFAGLGYRWWLRDLQDTSTAGMRVSGYTELWQTGYCRLGARARYLAPRRAAFFAEGGAKYPFYTGNSVDFAGSGVMTLQPVGRWSGFAETGVAWRHLKLTLSYEAFRYSRSPLAAAGNLLFFQPDSSSDLVGLSLGWAFR